VRRHLKLVFATLLAFVSVTGAHGHGVLLPPVHHALFLPLSLHAFVPGKATPSSTLLTLLGRRRSSFNSLFGPGLSGSISTRTFLLQEKNIVINSFTAGVKSRPVVQQLTASTLTSAIANTGQLQGDLYVIRFGGGAV
jgi:hypothetical protein